MVELAVREQGAFQRLYALKRLRPEYRDDERYRAMFLDEARVAGMIRHANVVSVLDVGEDERGPFLVMDFIEGVSVGELIRWVMKTDRTLSVQLVARIIRQVAAGIEAAHQLKDENGVSLNLIHRDVSPQNIIIGFDGVVRVTDFGIAKSVGRISQSTTNLLKGKAGYMAPEQLRFEDATQAADFFGLGVVFFELLAGRRLYAGVDSVAVARRILSEAPPDIFEFREDVHPAICELLFSLLAKTRETRPANAGEIVDRLDMVIDELSADEGTERIDRFLGEHFATEIEARANLRRRATSQSAGKWLPREEAADLLDATTVDSRPPAQLAPVVEPLSNPGSGHTQKFLFAVVVGLLAALVAVYFAWPEPILPSADAPTTDTPMASVSASETALPPAPVELETEENTTGMAESLEEVAPANTHAPPRPRRRRGMRRRAEMAVADASMDTTHMHGTAASRAVVAF